MDMQIDTKSGFGKLGQRVSGIYALTHKIDVSESGRAFPAGPAVHEYPCQWRGEVYLWMKGARVNLVGN